MAPPVEVRKTVTIVFSDLKGSTDLGERLDSESLREVLSEYFAEMKRILERHGGTVEKYIGDAIMAVFGLPRLHEDDALRGVRAAAEMQRALRLLNERLERRWGVRLASRIGVNTGVVVAGDPATGQRLVTGDTVNVAARLEQAAPEMQVLIGAPTYRLVHDAVTVEPVEPLALKGKSERVSAYRLVGVHGEEGVARRADARFVGRTWELGLLRDALDGASRERRARGVTVIGSAGIGKTKLVEEFSARLGGDVTMLRGHCLPYGEGITFLPLAEAVRQAARITEDDPAERARELLAAVSDGDERIAARLAPVLALSNETFSVQETFWAARKFFEQIARTRPLVLLIHDIHWAEPTFLALIEHLLDVSREVPILVLCTARHELLESQPRWMLGRENAARISLVPLSADDTAAIVHSLVGEVGIPVVLRDRIVAASEGNPLYVEQMLSMLVDEGTLARDEAGRWALTRDIDEIDVPPSIASLLDARLDRLSDPERAALVAGSVEGVTSHQGAVIALSAAALRDRIEEQLERLVEKVFLVAGEPIIPAERAFRFGHHLLRDSAYEAVLKRVRADLHERYVGWLTQATPPATVDLDEIVGFHLEQAHRYLAELGPLDDRGLALGVRAAQALATSGRRALARGDGPAAANLLERALAMLPEGAMALEVSADLADALRDMGQFAKASAVMEKTVVLAHSLGNVELQTRLEVIRLTIRYATDPEGWTAAAVREATRAVEAFQRAGDQASLARAWRLVAQVHGTELRYAAAEDAARRAVDAAAAAADRRQETRSLTALALCALHGPLRVREAIATCEALLVRASGDQRVESQLRLALSLLYGMDERFERARELHARARAVLIDLGARVQAATTSLYSARVELLAGEPARAEAELRADYATLRGLGERTFVSTTAALLGEALYAQGRLDEAAAMCDESERGAAGDDADSQYRWRCLRAKLLADAGDLARAERLAREAVGLLAASDALVKQADALTAFARVMDRAGRSTDRDAALRQAAALQRAKGNTAGARQIPVDGGRPVPQR